MGGQLRAPPDSIPTIWMNSFRNVSSIETWKAIVSRRLVLFQVKTSLRRRLVKTLRWPVRHQSINQAKRSRKKSTSVANRIVGIRRSAIDVLLLRVRLEADHDVLCQLGVRLG